MILLRSPADLPAPERCQGVYYLQRFVAGEAGLHRDWRVMVIGGRAVAAMERRSRGWITNRARGGECLAADCTAELARPAEAAAAALEVSYGGVDLIRTSEHRFEVLEVNGIPAWQGLEEATGIDVARLLVADLLARIPARPLEAVG